MTEQPDLDEVRAVVLAEWLGVSEQTVRELAVREVVVRRGRGLYALKESVRNYCDTMRKSLTGRGGEAQAATVASERARLAKAQADKVELANARARGALLDARAVEAEWSGVLRTVRAGMLAVPSRTAQRLPHLTPHDVAEIDAEVRAVLTEIGTS
jgi:phage terminase Nu1 subunit (DNA packaging protein)